jgi:indoleamine 2,3-dioxygenase
MKKSFKVWKSLHPNSWFSCVPGKNGFLPVAEPLEKLPEKFEPINNLLEKMKIDNGGYLEKAELFHRINKLPLYDLSEITDIRFLAALQRDYCFLASAVSLETSHYRLMNSGKYGAARNYIPLNIAEPLLEISKKNDVYPWLDYAYGYGLNNAILKEDCDPKNHLSYKTIRTFNGHKSEEGFINVHVAMVAQSGELLKYQQNCLECVHNNDRKGFNASLYNHYKVFSSIVETLQTMWKASNFKDYLTFRTFIMGQIGNKECYPTESILFEREGGTFQEHAYRGETGAQDSIVPSVDNFLQLSYPRNKLTEYLFNLRSYRPKDHQAYLNYLQQTSRSLGFREFCLGDADSSVLLLKNLNVLRMFRKKHWNLTKKYIIQSTKHPVATGGTPITTWLPNQLGATLEYMKDVIDTIDEGEITEDLDFFKEVSCETSDHIQTIMDEVTKLQNEFKEQNYDDFLVRN